MGKETKTNEIYKKNLAAFSEEYPVEAKKYIKICDEQPSLQVECPQGWPQNILQVTTESGRKLVLSHLYGEEEKLEEDLEKLGKIMPRTPFFIMGMGNIKRIERLLEAVDKDCLIVVYEPSLDIFNYIMHHWDISALLSDSPIIFIIEGLNEGKLKESLRKIMALDTMSLYKQIVSENYAELFSDELKKALKIAKEVFADLIVNWNTAKRYTDVVGKNVMYNIRHFLHGYNVRQLENFLKGEVPAFIISAGPSLNKNIEELKAAKGKACLIAVDTAIKPLLNHGIVPDFFVIVDGKKPTELMNHPEVSKVPLVTSVVVSTGIMDLHKGKKFFYLGGESVEGYIFEICEKASGKKGNLIYKALDTGGSVANTAFSLAYYMNASQIVFVGQDLAMTNGRTHADGTFKEKMDKLTAKENEELIPVEGIKGNTVYTRSDFLRYLLWFEDYIEKYELRNVIDATQGGARIHGTKTMTLKNAIKKVAKEEVNISEKLEEIPEMMDWSAKRKFKEYYDALPEKMHEVYVNAKRGERLYKKMEKLAQSENIDEKAYLRLLKQIGKVNKFMNEDEVALFVQSCLEHLNFLMRMGIYEQEEDEVEEQIQIAKHGKVLNFYIKHMAALWKTEMATIVEDRELCVSEETPKTPLDELIYELQKGTKKNDRCN